LTFFGTDYLPTDNALIYVQRQYIPENTYKVVELPKTDSKGQTILHLIRNNQIYNLMVIKNNVVLGIYNNILAFCEDYTIGNCKINLNAIYESNKVYNFATEMAVAYSVPVYDSIEETISFSFQVIDGTDKKVYMNVTRFDIFGNRSACDDTMTSSSGTLSCNVSGISDSQLKVQIYVNDEFLFQDFINLAKTNLGIMGYLFLFIFALCFILVFSNSKTGVLIAIGLSFAGAIGFGILNSSMFGLSASGIWLILIIGLGIYKINKERAQ
jgi:hypothetical protein